MEVTQGTVSLWENGITYPNAEKLPKLAELLHCTIDALFDHEQEA